MTQTTNSFNDAAFNFAQRSQEEWEKKNRKLSRIKKGLIIAAIAQAIFILIYILDTSGILIFDDFLFIIYLITTIAAYIIGGGLLGAIRKCWKIAKKLFFIGWICVPFPMDIFTGLFTSLLGFTFLPMGIIMMPLLMVFLNYRDTKKEMEVITDNIILNASI